MSNLSKDWPVYILLGAVAIFFIYVIVTSHLQNRKNQEGKNKENDKS